ncbi:MAG: hypothetical protein AAGB00_07650 [Planctomycetota bacterium]
MPTVLENPSPRRAYNPRVIPSRVDPATSAPFTLEQRPEPFGRWVGEPIWAPPLNSAKALAETMLKHTPAFTTSKKRWASVVRRRRDSFTQVREIDLYKSSIRLPSGRFFVSVTEQKDFDKIEEEVPACVQTRLDEFLDGPGLRAGVKVYYLKPLCVEVGDELILTSREDMMAAIDEIREEAFAAYHRRAPFRRSWQAAKRAAGVTLAIPRRAVAAFTKRRQRAIEAFHARMEFERRKTALDAARCHRKLRTDGCTFDEMLALTNPIDRTEVVEQYCVEEDLSNRQRDELLRIAAGSAPWFVTLAGGLAYVAAMTMVSTAPPLVMCDPAFVAEMPGSRGEVLKIGHFDEVGGVMHVEI